MSDHLSAHTALLAQLREHLAKERYCSAVIERYLAVAGCFLRYLTRRRISIQAVEPSHVSMYLRCELRRFRRRHHHSPPSIGGWCASHTAGIHQLLRLLRGQWPPSACAASPFQVFCQALCSEYAQWVGDRRGLAAVTICDLDGEARRFLFWCAQRVGEDLAGLTIPDIDAYLEARAATLRRVSRKGVSQRLRCFLRFLHATGRTARDFAPSVLAPKLYAFQAIPSALHPEQISAVLTTTRKDRSPKGLRDYTILMLLATYGLRAGEVTGLRLEDIDWRADRLRVRHTKTGSQTLLPLLPGVGEALLDYLRTGRPKTEAREIFIGACAPYRAFRSGSSLYTPIRRRLDAAGVQPVGKRGPHTFRHARAVSLLRAEVALKTIGDLLGHQSAASTTPYLKLATEELRAVALEIPLSEVQP